MCTIDTSVKAPQKILTAEERIDILKTQFLGEDLGESEMSRLDAAFNPRKTCEDWWTVQKEEGVYPYGEIPYHRYQEIHPVQLDEGEGMLPPDKFGEGPCIKMNNNYP